VRELVGAPPLGPEQRELVARVAALARERFAPRAARYDAESIFPAENYRDLREAGLLGLTIPAAYGGRGADALTYALCLLEIAKGCSSTALTFNMHSTVLTFVSTLGTEAQKRRIFGEVVGEGKLLASITSEPESSFRDKFVMRTVFRPVPGGYQVSGLKQFCSLGDAADYYFVSGVVEGARSAREGLISALVPRTSSGIKIEGTWNATGMRGTISHTIRYETTVGPDQVIGGLGGLFDANVARFALGYAATYLGIGEAAFDYIAEWARTKVIAPATEPIGHHPLTQKSIAEMGTAIRAARLMLYEACRLEESGDREATMLAVNQAKVMGAEAGAMVTERAMRLAGGRGILKEMPLERWRRDSLAGPVMPPSNDRCIEVIGRLLCGLKAATLEFE
jgi:alkylation response protein AidB-like acyl-CoA dehydrogenase